MYPSWYESMQCDVLFFFSSSSDTVCVFVPIVWEATEVSVVKQRPAYTFYTVIIWLRVPLCLPVVSITCELWSHCSVFSSWCDIYFRFQYTAAPQRQVSWRCVFPPRGRTGVSLRTQTETFTVYTQIHYMYAHTHTHTTTSRASSLSRCMSQMLGSWFVKVFF